MPTKMNDITVLKFHHTLFQALGDFCVDPDSYLVSVLDKKLSSGEYKPLSIIISYLCLSLLMDKY